MSDRIEYHSSRREYYATVFHEATLLGKLAGLMMIFVPIAVILAMVFSASQDLSIAEMFSLSLLPFLST